MINTRLDETTKRRDDRLLLDTVQEQGKWRKYGHHTRLNAETKIVVASKYNTTPNAIESPRTSFDSTATERPNRRDNGLIDYQTLSANKQASTIL